MTESEFKFEYPDDDGRAKRPWIKSGEKREKDGCDRVCTVLKERPWVVGEVFETKKNGTDDCKGIDMFVPMDNRLLEYLDIKKGEEGVPFQIKSSYKAGKEFVHSHEIYKKGVYCFANKEYAFVITGLDAREMIVADLVGQIVNLAKSRGMPEEDTLSFLAEELGDWEAVEKYCEQKVILQEVAWYMKPAS